MKHRLISSLCAALILLGTATMCGAGESGRQTISPYFLVEGRESSLEQFPLKDTRVEAVISGVFAAVTVRQTYANLGAAPISGTYVFPGSTRAAVNGMKMTIGERVTRAVIREKEEARKTYQAARQQGKNAALLEHRRANVFSMEVANIMPGDTIEIELTYTELLVPDNGTYQFVYPGVVGPRYTSLTAEEAPAAERWVQNPYLRQGAAPRTEFSLAVALAAGMPIQEISCRSHDIDVAFRDEAQALVTATGKDGFAGDRDFILDYRLSGRQISSGLLLQRGEDENFFLLMTQPPARVEPAHIPAREYLFVIDVSGSMSGYPLDTAKVLVRHLIGELRPTDAFNVLFFAGDSEVLSETPVAATPANVARALAMIDTRSGGGGTELEEALARAMRLPEREGVSRTMVVISDGYIQAEQEVFELVRQNLDRTNVFAFGIGSSVNRYLIEGLARAGQGEPFVVTRADEAQAAARDFARYISQPVMTDVEVSFQGIDAYEVEPPVVPDLFAERPLIVIGKWRGDPGGLVTVSGTTGAGAYTSKIPVGGAVTLDRSGPLPYLWARSRISRIADFNGGRDSARSREEIVGLGLKYNLLTPFTSFVAVAEIVRNPNRDSSDVTQPLPLPKDVSELAVGGGVQSVPEPGLVLLAALLLGALLLPRLRRRRGWRR